MLKNPDRLVWLKKVKMTRPGHRGCHPKEDDDDCDFGTNTMMLMMMMMPFEGGGGGKRGFESWWLPAFGWQACVKISAACDHYHPVIIRYVLHHRGICICICRHAGLLHWRQRHTVDSRLIRWKRWGICVIWETSLRMKVNRLLVNSALDSTTRVYECILIPFGVSCWIPNLTLTTYMKGYLADRHIISTAPSIQVTSGHLAEL